MNKIVFLITTILLLSSCANIEQIDNKTRQYGSNKPEFVVNKISIQSYSLKYYGSSSVSEKDAVNNWNKKANSLCGKKKASTTIINNEAVTYLKRGHESQPSDQGALVAVCVCSYGRCWMCICFTGRRWRKRWRWKVVPICRWTGSM